MRKLCATAALAGFGLLFSGAGVAAAQDPGTGADPVMGCVHYIGWDGETKCLLWAPTNPNGQAGSVGYGSAGTASLSDLLSRLVAGGSAVLSLDLPKAMGSYAPSSTGSYGPEAVLGQLSTTVVGSALAAS